jgi:hypothetical protein
MQNSCEPVHVQLNPLDFVVSVINRTYRAIPNLTVEADVYGLDSKLLSHQSAKVSLAISDVKENFSLSNVLAGSKEVNFVVLNLKDSSGKVISHNTYWLSADNNYTSLQTMPRTKVATTVLNEEQIRSETVWTLKFTNSSKKLAFFINPRLMGNDKEILPAFWSSNYFSLAPGESMIAKVSASTAALTGKKIEMLVKGWNVEKNTFSLISR